MIHFAKVIKSKIKSGLKNLLIEILKDDTQEHICLTIPGVESVALKEQKVCLHQTDKNGTSVIFGIPLETDIEDGEMRLTAKDSESRLTVSSFYMKKDGKIEIGVSNLKKVVNESFLQVYNPHTHDLDLSKQVALATKNIMTPQNLTQDVSLS